MHSLPISVPKLTKWTILEGNNIQVIDEYYSYIDDVEYLDLKYNLVTKISDSFLSKTSKSKTLKWLDFSQNKLKKIPQKLQILRTLISYG